MITKRNSVAIAAIALFVAACSASKTGTTPGETPSSANSIPSLKEVFKDDFGIGTAMNTPQIEERDPRADALIRQQFNMATPENVMKAEMLHPQWDVYKVIEAKKNG